MNKFEEMNYLIDKLQDKKQKELKRINNEFTKVVKEDYDYDVPDNWCIVRKTYEGRDINTPFMGKYFEDRNEYERMNKYKYYRVFVRAEFKPKGFFNLLKENKENSY